MSKIYLIDEQYLKETVNVSAHKNATEIVIAFKSVEEFYIIDLLSTPLYDLYINHLKNKTTLTEKQAELFQKIKLYYALLVQYELMFNIFTISNQGNQENQNAPSISDVREKRKEVMSKAETVKGKIVEYLKKNKIEFPEYYSADDHNGDAAADTSNSSPIIFY